MATFKNHEGYADTTAYLAEKRIEKAHRDYLRKGIGYPTSGYMLGELYCFRLAARKMGKQR